MTFSFFLSIYSQCGAPASWAARHTIVCLDVRKDEEEKKNEEKKRNFGHSYLGNGLSDFLQIWNVDSPIWRATLQQIWFQSDEASPRYKCVKMTFSFFLSIYSQCGAPASWAARHTIVCLDVRKDEEEKKNEEKKRNFGHSYLGNGLSDFLQIWNVDSPIWRATLQQIWFQSDEASPRYKCVKMTFSFFLSIYSQCGAPASWAARHTIVCLDVRKDEEEKKNEEKKRNFGHSYLGNGLSDFLQIWNVDSPIWRATLQQIWFQSDEASPRYKCVKMTFSFFLSIYSQCGAPASWAARHTIVCLDVRKDEEEKKNEEKKRNFGHSYLGNGLSDFLQIWNVDSPIWRATLQQIWFQSDEASPRYKCVKITFSFFLSIYSRCGAPASWAARHTIVCLELTVWRAGFLGRTTHYCVS